MVARQDDGAQHTQQHEGRQACRASAETAGGWHGAIVHTGPVGLQEVTQVPEDESVLTRSARAPDRVIAYGADPAQNLEIRGGGADAGQRPLIVIIHGGFWRPDIDRAHLRPIADAIAAAGWTVALPEYARVA